MVMSLSPWTKTTSRLRQLPQLGFIVLATASPSGSSRSPYSNRFSSTNTPTTSSSPSRGQSSSSSSSYPAFASLQKLARRLHEPAPLRAPHASSTTTTTTPTAKKPKSKSAEKRRLAELATELCEGYGKLPALRLVLSSSSSSSSSDSPVDDERKQILLYLATECRTVEGAIDHAVADYLKSTSNQKDASKFRIVASAISELRHASTPPYEDVLHFVLKQNSVKGMAFLIALREDLMQLTTWMKTETTYSSHHESPSSEMTLNQLKELDAFLQSLFVTWFAPGMMEFRRITYDRTPASVIETIATKEQVHPMKSLEDLRSRLGSGRRVFALFHPLLPNVPLVFVHVALLHHIPSHMQDVMECDDVAAMGTAVPPKVACFYSISNGQKALAGVGLGELLLKQSVRELHNELPSLQTFVTLSPIPKFRTWLQDKIHQDHDGHFFDETLLSQSDLDELMDCGLLSTDNGELTSWGHLWRLLREEVDFSEISSPTSLPDERNGMTERQLSILQSIMTKLTCRYLCLEKHRGRPLDAVCRFHVGNGAEVYRVNFAADPSRKGLQNAFGMMVNYLYDLDRVPENQASFELDYSIPVSPDIQSWIDQMENP